MPSVFCGGACVRVFVFGGFFWGGGVRARLVCALRPVGQAWGGGRAPHAKPTTPATTAATTTNNPHAHTSQRDLRELDVAKRGVARGRAKQRRLLLARCDAGPALGDDLLVQL